MICRKCGHQSAEGARYCTVCGQKLEAGLSKKNAILPIIAGAVLLAAGLFLSTHLQKGEVPASIAAEPTVGQRIVEASAVVPDAPAQSPSVVLLSTGYTRLRKGDTISFGTYTYDKKGTLTRPIIWDVLEVQDEMALVLSHDGLDCIPYNKKHEAVTWETSSIRAWLNDDFLNSAFTDEEQICIDLTPVDNSDSQGYYRWNSSGGFGTDDYVFLLSYAEAKEYLDITGPGTNGPVESRAIPTPYAAAKGAYISDDYKTADNRFATRWWLRSPGIGQTSAALVHSRGCLGEYECRKNDVCVRPAMWVNWKMLLDQ